MTTAAGPIRLVIADDHALVRDGIRQFLEQEPDLRVVGDAGTGDEALALCERLQPDLWLCSTSACRPVRHPGCLRDPPALSAYALRHP